MASAKVKKIYIYRDGAENKLKKKFLKSISYKNIPLTEVHVYGYWKRKDNTFIDTMQILLFLSRVTLAVELLGKAGLRR